MREAIWPRTLISKVLPRAQTPSWPLRYGLSVLAVVLAWLLRTALDPLLGNVQAFAFFYVAVALSAWWAGRGPALLSLLLGYLAGHWFFLPPRHALWLEDFADVMELVTYFAVAGTIILLIASLRKAEARAHASARALLLEKHELEAEITERQRAEAALRQSEHKFRFLVENALVGVYIIQEGCFSYVNPKFAQIFGYSPAELALSVPVLRLVAEPDRPKVAEMLRRRLEGQIGQVHYTFQALRKDGTALDVEVLGALMSYQDKPAVIGTLLDITERKQAEAILARDHQELERLVRERTARLQETIADLQHFSYSITHDLHAPLRAIHGFAGLLEEECAGCFRPHAAELFGRIKTASSRMDSLLHAAVAYAKIARADLPARPVDLSRLLAGIIQHSPNLQPDKVELRIEGKLPAVLGNEAALRQCFSNLLDNALKFVAPGVHPRVRIWAQLVDSGKLIVDSPTPSGSQPSTLNSQLVREPSASQLSTLNSQLSTHPRFRPGQRHRHPQRIPGKNLRHVPAPPPRRAVPRHRHRPGPRAQGPPAHGRPRRCRLPTRPRQPLLARTAPGSRRKCLPAKPARRANALKRGRTTSPPPRRRGQGRGGPFHPPVVSAAHEDFCELAKASPSHCGTARRFVTPSAIWMAVLTSTATAP